MLQADIGASESLKHTGYMNTGYNTQTRCTQTRPHRLDAHIPTTSNLMHTYKYTCTHASVEAEMRHTLGLYAGREDGELRGVTSKSAT